MAVEIVHHRGGYELKPNIENRRQLDELVLSNFHSFQPLTEDDYNLTEISEIEDPDYRYTLVVLENGLGFRRAIPLRIPNFSRRIQTPIGPKGNTVELWYPGQIVVISVFSPETWRTKVYDIIRFVTGPSPK